MKHFKTAALVCALGFSAAAQADTAEWTLQGVITPAACGMVMSGNGVHDFGTVAASALKEGEYHRLDTKNNKINIDCNGASTRAAVKFLSERGTSMNASQASFGLGLHGDKKIGYGQHNVNREVQVKFTPQSDFAEGKLLESKDKVKWSLVNSTVRTPNVNNDHYLTVANEQGAPASFTQMTMTLNSTALISGDLVVEKEVPFRNVTTISLEYL
ncbi:DUF1120 domain-containing protein [Chromobacterium amazonense]|uniref:DUF1120 domain-containing protein n=1 Tax=Chromobacterium amazonense TaxID=1382803 RepID=A0ABU8UY97_9NEIS|nr:DUF1120 domain-containing protein [Chromobacterium amazonense]MDQ4540974.1 DUF1120 domain-containing protein [Chromobacterium amazonense]